MSYIPMGTGDTAEPQQLAKQGPTPLPHLPLIESKRPSTCLQQTLAFAQEGAGFHSHCPAIRGPFQEAGPAQAL